MGNKINYFEKENELGLNIPDEWKDDVRPKFIALFSPLLKGTEYRFETNRTDSTSKILEVYREGNPKRIMGISGKRGMILWVFFNPDLYQELRKRIDIPDNQQPNRSQPHVKISLEHLWNIICVLTRKEQYMTEEVSKGTDESVVESSEFGFEDIKHNLIVIKINKLYQEGMSQEALYEATRGIWKIKIERAERADYALSVCKGIVKEVYQIDSWYPAGTTNYNTRVLNRDHCVGRAEFVGKVAPKVIRNYYVGKSITPLFKYGEASPVKVIEKYQEGKDYGSFAVGRPLVSSNEWFDLNALNFLLEAGTLSKYAITTKDGHLFENELGVTGTDNVDKIHIFIPTEDDELRFTIRKTRTTCKGKLFDQVQTVPILKRDERHDIVYIKTTGDILSDCLEIVRNYTNQGGGKRRSESSKTNTLLDSSLSFHGSAFLNNNEYEFVRKIQHSGKNNVILVKHKSDGSLWVGKEYTEYNKNVFDRLCRLNIEGIPHYAMCIEKNGTLFTLEEYIEGRDLKTIFDKEGVFENKTIWKIALELCDILEEIHKQDPPMIHRDIKPSNIIMSDVGKVFLIDFNASKEYHEGNTQDTVFLGTHYFAAPEQILGYGASDERTDIFGLGATMNYLLTGMFVMQFLTPGPLESIIKKCTRMEKEDRYANVNELRKALLEGECK